MVQMELYSNKSPKQNILEIYPKAYMTWRNKVCILYDLQKTYYLYGGTMRY